MSQKILFITPPFTQLNTPYPATAYLKGFLNTQNIASRQADLGIELILDLFSGAGFRDMFQEIGAKKRKLSKNARTILSFREAYEQTIDPVISFLQGKNPSLAYLICQGGFLPEAGRFHELDDLEWAFGSMGLQDKAKHLATLYLEDISDLIVEILDPWFGFSRYAESLGRSASDFTEIHEALQREDSFIDKRFLTLVEAKIDRIQPTLVAITVPFPGNLYCALKSGQWIHKNRPEIKIVLGGGYVNTELRSLNEARVFQYVDFITLDDGEAPLAVLIRHLNHEVGVKELKRTFTLLEGKLTYCDGSLDKDIPQSDVGIPDYSELPLDQYLSVIEIVNPMHRLWSDGRWNKLTLAHGCYWAKCTFCDITLDYIRRYEPNKASLLCDRIEAIISQTGTYGFHFVDEAASPALLRALATEIISRKITIAWWTNIRFEKSFSSELCHLLKESGCIAVSGGLEVASDRLLKLINKGVTVAQVAKVAGNFTEAGIMVHAYLMYGFPTQTAAETIDSLEVVRQLFEEGLVQSGFWHHFALTAHSGVSLDPQKFKIQMETSKKGCFANNDLLFNDPLGCEHGAFSEGLRKSLFNYMHGIGFDLPLQAWFDFEVPETSIEAGFIRTA
ncbi:MAG: radical SAM protein [Bacteroidota bacterium]